MAKSLERELVMTPSVEPGPSGESGVSLVEVLVALALLALIGVAGFSVLDQVIRVQNQTEGRLDRLASFQRTAHVFSLDLMQARGGSLGFADGAVSFRRNGGAGDLAVRYSLEDGALVRGLSGANGGGATRQQLLVDVRTLRWGFWSDAGAWIDGWPPANAEGERLNPKAVALEVDLVGPALSGVLRRVVVLPEEVGR